MNHVDLLRTLGQRFILGIQGLELNSEEIECLEKLAPGGIVLFKRNYDNIDQLAKLIEKIQSLVMKNSLDSLPAWVSIDHEGGRVQRLGKPFTQFPPAKEWGELNSPKTSFEAGYTMAKELLAVGVNVNFAPVLDVASSFEAPALGDRIFHTDKSIVASLGAAMARGLQRGGVLSVGKHFPGHGALNVDSHDELPTCSLSLKELESEHWYSFKKTIRARLDGMMLAHVLCQSVDDQNISTFSQKMLKLLREDLRCEDKLIFTDDLEMGALANDFSLEESVLKSIQAGCDHLLVCHSTLELLEIMPKLLKAFDDGAIDSKNLEASEKRIVRLKQKFLLPYSVPSPVLAKEIVGAQEFSAVSLAIQERKALESGPSSLETEKA